jgi:hypothetical protein
MRRLIQIPFVAAMMSVWTSPAAAQSNACAALIPEKGAYQLTVSSGDRKSYSSAKDMYCSSDWISSSQSSGWSFDVDVTGKGSAGAGASNSANFNSRASFCSDSSRDFTESDKVALYRLQGDRVLANAFVQCMALLRPTGVLSATGSSLGDDVTLTVTPNLSQNAVERVTAVVVVSGATSKEGIAITPGTPLVGRHSVVGGYTLTAPRATFIVKTTTGDLPVTVTRCRTGTAAGTFEIRATTFADNLTPAGRFVKDVPFGPAGCHPHCKMNAPPAPDSGDMILQMHAGPPNVVLRNLTFQCVGAGCPFADSWDVRLVDDRQIKLAFRNRSAPIMVHLEADQLSPGKTGSEKLLGNGAITYGEPFSVAVPKDASGPYIVRAGVISPLESMTNGAPYKVLASKMPVGDKFVWTLQLDDMFCAQ